MLFGNINILFPLLNIVAIDAKCVVIKFSNVKIWPYTSLVSLTKWKDCFIVNLLIYYTSFHHQYWERSVCFADVKYRKTVMAAYNTCVYQSFAEIVLCIYDMERLTGLFLFPYQLTSVKIWNARQDFFYSGFFFNNLFFFFYYFINIF
jgi:hypothetical protein